MKLELDPTVKRDWIDDLRSEEFEQGKGVLCSSGERSEYCCLGVLMRRLDPEALEQGRGIDEFIPESIAGEIGLLHGAQVELAHKNDKGASFSVIADWIEENL